MAGDVAGICGRLLLFDAAPAVRERLRRRYGSNTNIEVLSPEEVEALPEGALDLVVVVSVVQYLSRAELVELCELFHAKLKGHGALVVADVIPRDVGPLADARALVAFAWRGGFLLAALAGLVRTFFSDYRRLRGELGLSQYDEAELLGLLEDAGFAPERLPTNVGHNPARMTFVARPQRLGIVRR